MSSVKRQFDAPGEQPQVIAVESLKNGDELIVSTENSQYVFNITDARERRGMLSGGQLGNNAREAVFYCVKIGEGIEDIDNSHIRTNAKAIFFLDTGNGIQRLLTSHIVKLQLTNRNRAVA